MSDMNDFIQKLRSVEQNVSNQPSAVQRLNIFSPKKTSGSPLQQITDFAKNNAVKAPVPTPTNPVNGKWYKGDDPTRGEVIGKALVLKDTDPTKAGEWMSNYRLLQGTKSSKYYDPHSQATNRAVAELQSRGIDTTGIGNPEWFEKNRYLMDYYTPTSGTNEVKTPGKDASTEEQQAFWYRQAYKAMDTTSKAQSELDQVKKDIDWYVNNPGMNLTDQEIKELVMGGLQKNQPTLYAMEQGRASGVPIELNAAVAFNEDLIDGYIWQARNKNKDGSYVTDNPELAMAYAVNGYGNGYQENPELRGKLDPFSGEWKPYSVGSTLEEEGRYFGVYQFSRKWLEDNQAILAGDDEKAKKYYYNVQAAVELSEKIDAETDALDKTIDYYVAKGWSPEKIEQAIQNGSVVPGAGVDGYDDLFDLDKTIEGKDKDKLKGTAWATDYSWDGTKESIAKKVAKKKIADNQDVIDAFGEASEQHANWVLKHENLNQASETVEQFGNNYEKDAFKSIVPGQMGRYALGGFMEIVAKGSHRIGAETIDRIAVQNFEDVRTIQAYDDAQAALEQTNANIENTAVDIRMIASSFHNGEYPNTVEEAQQMLAPIYDRFGYDPSVWEVAGLDISQADDMPAWQILNYMSVLENDPDNEDALIGLYQAADNLSYDRSRTYDSRWDQWEGSFIDGHWIGSDEEKAECLASAKDVYKLMQANKYAADIKKEETKKGELEGQISSTQEAYDAAQNRRERNAVQLEKAIQYYRADGSYYDPSIVGIAEELPEIMSTYTPVDYMSISAYDYMLGAIDPETGDYMYDPAQVMNRAMQDASFCAQRSAAVVNGIKAMQAAGYEFTDEELKNADAYVADLDRKGRLASYFILEGAPDFEENVQKGVELAQGSNNPYVKTMLTGFAVPTTGDYVKLGFDWLTGNPMGGNISFYGNIAANQLKVEVMTKNDVNRFFAIYATQGEEAALKYYDDLMDDDTGLLAMRRSEAVQKWTSDFAGQNVFTGLLATGVSLATKLKGGYETAINNTIRRVMGESSTNPFGKENLLTDVTTGLRTGAKESFHKMLPGVDPEKIDFAYDAIISGAADSLVQAWATSNMLGGILELVPGGDKVAEVIAKAANGEYSKLVNFGIKVASDFTHAAPMGWIAASEAYRQAEIEGATPEQLNQIYTITFLAETVTEAVTVGNIKGMFSAGENAARNQFTRFVGEMLSDVIEEATGEMIGEAFEQVMMKNMDGYMSEWDINKQKYIDAGYGEAVAEQLADKDMLRSIMDAGLAAVISTPFSSGGGYIAGRTQNRKLGNYITGMGLNAETSLVELGLDQDVNSTAYQLAKSIDENTSNGKKSSKQTYGQLVRELLGSEDPNVNQQMRDILEPDKAAVRSQILARKEQLGKVDALKWMTEEVERGTEEDWRTQTQADMALLRGETNTTPEATAENIGTVLGGMSGQSDTESTAAGASVVNMAKGNTAAATGAMMDILSIDGRSKNDISWAALTTGASHNVLQGIVDKAAAGTEISADDVAHLRKAANTEQTGNRSEQMKENYAETVLNKVTVNPAQTETEAAPSETAQVPAAKLSPEQQARLEELEAEQREVGPYKMKVEDSAELRELQAIRDGEVAAEETVQQEETNDQFIERITEGVEETEEDVAEREAEEAQEAETQSQSEQDQAVALQLQNAKDSGMNDVRVAAILKNGTGFGDADAQAIAQKVLGMAGNGDVAGRVLGGAIGLNPGRSADIKEAIAWAAMTDGQANVRLSELFDRTAKGENVNWFDVEAIISLAANERANDQGEQANFARNVLNGRVANEEADIMASENMADATKTEQKAVDSAQEEVTRAEEALDNATKEADAAAKNLEAVGAEVDYSEKGGETRAALEQATNRVAGAVNQRTQAETGLENAQRKLSIAQLALQSRQQEIMNETRAAATTNAQQNVQQEQEQAAQEQVNRAQEIAEQDRRQAVQDENDSMDAITAEETAENLHPNATKEDKQKVADMTKEILKTMSVDDIIKRGRFKDQLEKKFGVKIRIADTTEGNTKPRQNAYVNPKTGEITLDRTATMSDMLYAVLPHELFHVARNSNTYGDLLNALIKFEYGNDTSRLDSDIKARKELYTRKLTQLGELKQGEEFTDDDAREEIGGDIIGKLIKGNQELINRFAEEQPSLARRIVDSIKSFVKRVAGIKGVPTNEMRQLVDMFDRAIKSAQWKNARNGQNKYSITDDTQTTQTIVTDGNGNALATELPGGSVISDSVTKHSLSSFSEEEQQKVRKALLDSGRFTPAEVDNYLNDALSIAAIIAADKSRLDFVADPEKTMLKNNAEYVKTLDASTLCAKRLVYQGTFDAIQHELPNTPLTPADLIDLANMMREMGYEAPCGICYVESRRRNLGNFAQKWLDSYDGAYKPTLDEVTTTDGLEALRKSHPDTYNDFIKAMNNYGTMNPKVVQLRTDYRGEIRSMTPGQIQKVKDIGGLRVQSFSDFETPHLLDMVQAVMDMSAKGLTAQAYTKVPNFAWVFGNTGIKINLSLIGKGTGLDADGNLLFDDVEGMNHEEAFRLRDAYSGNVGTILVGINDEHIKAAMADPRIDFIIPFHKSGWTSEELAKMPVLNSYSDYTDSQNEKAIVGKTKKGGYKTESLAKSKRINFQPVGKNGYWDFSKTGKENAEEYLRMCAEDGRLPKFSKFLVDNGDGSFSLQPDGSTDGYWKTLIDFKMYNNDGVGAPQQEVKPDINMNQAVRVLDEFDGKGVSSLPVAQPVVDRYVEEYKAKNPGRKYSLPNDADYLAAVERGEMDEAQRMVDEAADLSFPDSKAKDENGKILRLFHGTQETFNEFKPNRFLPESNGESRIMGYFSENSDYASRYGDVRPYYVNITNPLEFSDAPWDNTKEGWIKWFESKGITGIVFDSSLDRDSLKGATWGDGTKTYSAFEIFDGSDYWGGDGNLTEQIAKAGYDGMHWDYDEKAWIPFNNNAIKSADPVTYDDQGNVIPLSERFNDQREDIRYSLPSDNVLKEQITSWLEGYYNNPEQTTAEPEGPQRQFGNQTAQKSDELDNAVKQWLYDNSIYEPDTNKDQINRAIQWIRSNRQYADDDGFQGSLQKIMNPRFNSQSPDGQVRILATMAMSIAKANASGNPIDSVATQVMIADLYNRVGTTAGQTLQARKIFRAMTPEGRIATIRKMLTDEQARLDAKNIHVDLKFSDWLYDAAANAKNEQDMTKVRKEAARQLGEQLPSNWRDRIRSFRMLSMLANPRTHVRNFIGNALFIPAVAIKNKTGALAEMALKTKDKTKTLRPWLPQDIREFAREDARFMKDTLTGEAKYNEETMVQRATNPLGGPIGWLSEKNSNALEWEDWFFLRGHYRRALGGWMVANNYSVEDMKNNTDLLEQGRQYAINEAQKATYRDFNELASKLNGLTRDAKTVWGKTLAFGVDAVLPFKKTPANILRRGLEYSPIGIAKGLYSMTRPLHAYQQAIRNNTEIPSYAKSPNQVIDEICSGLSGTGVMIVGAILANLGAVSVGLNDDDDKFAELKGAQKYAINPGRIINNIFGTHLLGEDVTYTMDWAAPMSMPFFVGAAIQKQFENGGEIDIGELVNAMGNVMEPVFNLSMLDGVNSLLKTAQGSDDSTLTQIGAKVLSNYVTSYVPSFVGALTRTAFDDSRRMSFVESGNGGGVLGTARYAYEQIQNKIPGWSKTNIPYRDVWGNVQSDPLGERIAENFFSPGYVQSMKEDVVMGELERLYNATGDNSMVPKDPPKYFDLGATVTDNPRKVVLTDQEWDQYRVARGQLAYQTLGELMVNPYYLAADDEVQAYMVSQVWSYANQEGKKVVAPDYNPSKNYGEDPIVTIVQDTKKHFKTQTTKAMNKELLKAVNAGDETAFEAVVEDLHENGVDDKTIRGTIGDKYRPIYQEAYLSGTEEGMDKMFEIEEMLSMTGYSFDFKTWRKSADKNKQKEEFEEEDF